VAKLSFLAGFGAGYVLGAKAGTERYEQIRRAWENAKENPQFQGVAGMAQARADAVVNSVKARMGQDTGSTGTGTTTTVTPTTVTTTTVPPSVPPTVGTPSTLPPPDIIGGV
jgi:hypothetical protein